LGELIEIARALTTEREIDKLLNLILQKPASSPPPTPAACTGPRR